MLKHHKNGNYRGEHNELRSNETVIYCFKYLLCVRYFILIIESLKLSSLQLLWFLPFLISVIMDIFASRIFHKLNPFSPFLLLWPPSRPPNLPHLSLVSLYFVLLLILHVIASWSQITASWNSLTTNHGP